MPCCSAYGCSNRTEQARKKGLTFHRFPKKEDLREAWIKAVRRKNWNPGKNSVLCSVHFTPKDFDRTSLVVTRLIENAVPCIFPGFPAKLQEKMEQKRKAEMKEKESMNIKSEEPLETIILVVDSDTKS